MTNNFSVTDYISGFISTAKKMGDTPEVAARQAMRSCIAHLPFFIARTLVDVYGLDPWEIAHLIYSEEGLNMSKECAAQVLRAEMHLEASEIAKIFLDLGFGSSACQYFLTEADFTDEEAKKAVKSVFKTR
jgi:hypothetical protein